MLNTYTQIHIHGVFVVKNSLSLINEQWQEEMYKNIGTIIKNNGNELLAIGGMPDHIHFLMAMRPTKSIAYTMQDVKSGSSMWVNQNDYAMGKFQWQAGFCAFSHGKSQLRGVIQYINEQKELHLKHTFQEEYKELIRLFGVEYDESAF